MRRPILPQPRPPSAATTSTSAPLTAVLIERAQFALNKKIYDPKGFKDQIDFEGSWLDWFLFETESFHAKARRFTR